MDRVGGELGVDRNRVSLLAAGAQIPKHLCIDECGDGPYTVVVWSPALTNDHRIEAVCAALTPAVAAGLRATEDGQKSLSLILPYLEEILKSSSKRMLASRGLFEINSVAVWSLKAAHDLKLATERLRLCA